MKNLELKIKKSGGQILVIFFFAVLFLTFGLSLAEAQSTGPVKVVGRQLMVDFDGNGTYEPYRIKGVGYSPYPVGTFPSQFGTCEYVGGPNPISCDVTDVFDRPALMDRDFPLLVAMNANTIRAWSEVTNNLLNKAQEYGLKIIAGFWVNTGGSECVGGQMVYNVPDFSNLTVRNDYKNRFVAYVNAFKNHPAVLFWAIGNENNNHLDPNNAAQIQAWYSLVNEMAQLAHQAEGVSYHPVAVVNGDLQYIGQSANGTTDAQMNYLDIWGANVYRANSFGILFTDYSAKSTKPLWIAEYGVDSWFTDQQNPPNSFEDTATQAQWTGRLWDEIITNKSVCIGATVMEYSDEWWKPMGWGGSDPETVSEITMQDYDGVGPLDTSCPQDGTIDWYPPSQDNFFNEEWWGIMAIEPGAPGQIDVIIPRPVYGALTNRFECSETAAYYAGSDNGKSCDGTDACCAGSTYKSKNGSCVLSCSFRNVGGGCSKWDPCDRNLLPPAAK